MSYLSEELFNRYLPLKEQGLTARELFYRARLDGNRGMECIFLIMALYKMDLGKARDTSYEYFESDAWLYSPEKAEWDKKNGRK